MELFIVYGHVMNIQRLSNTGVSYIGQVCDEVLKNENRRVGIKTKQ